MPQSLPDALVFLCGLVNPLHPAKSVGSEGSLQVIVGPMFSGKSTELLRRLRRFSIAKRKCILIKYKGDTRYSVDCVSTHDRIEMAATSSSKLSDLYDKIAAFDVVGIDEGQFFPDLVPFCDAATDMGKTVIVGGLDGDFQRKPFGKILDLIPRAEHIVKLTAVCFNCGGDAPYTRRITDETALEVIGGADKYVASCRACFTLRVSSSSTPPPSTPEGHPTAAPRATKADTDLQRQLVFDAGWPVSPQKEQVVPVV